MKTSYNCPRCDVIMPLKEKKDHKCNPILIMEKIAKDSEEREKNK